LKYTHDEMQLVKEIPRKTVGLSANSIAHNNSKLT